ncbi:MAG TPA: OsmC family protein [Bacteroidota bacterium]|nr:OsmC family protein [Bacteroidota bacterium]
MEIKAIQAPLKSKYRDDPASARITLVARAGAKNTPLACSVDLGRAIYEAEAHAGVGGTGSAACSGDLLLGALAACAQITCQLVGAAMGLKIQSVGVTVEGTLDLRGTLGVSKDVPVGFEEIRVSFDLKAPEATREQLDALKRKTEEYCVVYQTLTKPPPLEVKWI